MDTRRLRLTPRGTGLTVLGGGALVAGVLLGVSTLVQVGLLLLMTVGAGAGLLLMQARDQARGALRLTRRVVPHPVTEGDPATVSVELTSGRTGARAPRLDRLQIAERAARELSGGAPLRARVSRERHALRLSYPISPTVRGRWSVGPVQLHRADPFGVARWSGPLGEPALVAVRPRITPLGVSSTALSSDADRVVVGARSPSPDDTALRDYRTGDDLRRVHWPTSARRGELVVRQDERSGRRPASVLLDLPLDPAAGEWSIRLAASVAAALVGAGHHVRLLGGDVLDAARDHHRPDTSGAAVAALLDQTVDLTMPADLPQRRAWMRTAMDTLQADAGGSELVLALVGALDSRTLAALARTGETTHGWAMVRTSESGDPVASAAAESTAERLRRAGWAVCLVRVGEDHRACWERLLGSDDRAVMSR
ncbi:MAG: DUF58 domain-containing protein [Actinotalea sp.]|nr:DUF58 domain-containing protein [Actinotalea sp.]